MVNVKKYKRKVIRAGTGRAMREDVFDLRNLKKALLARPDVKEANYGFNGRMWDADIRFRDGEISSITTERVEELIEFFEGALMRY